MIKNILTKSDFWKTYIIPLVIIAFLFIIIIYHITITINNYFYDHMLYDSENRAENYTARLSDSIRAAKIIDKLLIDKLIIASNMITKNSIEISNEYLFELGEDLQIDEIYWYNPDGEIIYTNHDYLGWKAYIGHPVYEFLHSGENIWIEDIRKDTESGKYYKYAYARMGDGGNFIQIGISADIIYELTNQFCPHNFINALNTEEDIIFAYYIKEENEYFYCDHNIEERNYNLDAEEKKAINDGDTFFITKQYNNHIVLEALLPIYYEGNKVGTLLILYSLDNTKYLINKVTFIVSTFLLIICLIYVIMIITIFGKNNKLKELAYYDAITKLPKKNKLLEFIYKEINISNSGKKKSAFIVINCTNTNLVGMVFGSDTLDKLFLEKADRLRKFDKYNGNVYRYSDNTFIIYIDNYRHKGELYEKSARIITEIKNKTSIIETDKLINYIIGILEIQEGYEKEQNIIKYLDLMSQVTKAPNDTNIWFFNDIYQKDLLLNELIEKELRQATHDGFENEFYIEYQPQLDLRTNKIVGLEALTRWRNKELGYISPIKFISIAEQNQLIIPLGEWIIVTVCKFIKRIEEIGISDIKVAINISVVQLLQEDFIDFLVDTIKEINITPRNLEIEITETNLMSNYDIVNEKLNRLRNMGITISLDDFGTGYSSLARMKNLNIDVIKIDKTFIDNITKCSIDNDDEDIFVKSIITIASQLNLKVVAEGVETEIQKEYLKVNKCDIMQGYLFSKPVSEDAVIELLERKGKL